MTPVATADHFVSLLARSGLLSGDQLDPYRVPGAGGSDPQAVSRRLVQDRLLTPFQAEQLAAGRYDGFFFANKFKLLTHLGSGGVGHVFLAEHMLLQRLVAVKVLQLGEAAGGAAERFLREARAVAALDHPNIVRVFDMDRAGGDPYLVMEYVDGTNLHAVVAGHGRLAAARAAGYIRQAAVGLDHAAKAGLVHRDVKPGNLLLDRGGTVKLLDLGLARFLTDAARNDNLTARYDRHVVVGTADFIAPEQALDSSTADVRSDIYSLGATFYFLLTGRTLFPDGTVTQKLMWHQNRTPVPVRDLNPGVPAAMAAVLERMMAKVPADRYQTPAEVVAAVARWGTEASLPPAVEMPTIRPDWYRLGLSPVPTNLPASTGSPTPNLAGPESETDRVVPPGILRAPVRPNAGDRISVGASGAPFSLPVTNALPEPPLEFSDNPASALSPGVVRPAKRRRWGIPAGVVLLLALSVAVWGFTRSRDSRNTGTDRTPTPATGATLTAGGSTFVQPLVDEWVARYERETPNRIRYDGIGSGLGVKGMTDRSLDFGCTDAFLTDAQLAEAKGGAVIHVPLVLGAVVPTYNLPGLAAPLRFTGPLLADIYLGKVRRWDDLAIRANNPGVPLPATPIEVVRRSGESGTSFIWTEYLSKASGEWRDKVGAGTAVSWPVGRDGKGNDGVATVVSRTVGAIGFVELSFALANNLAVGEVKNRDGRYVRASPESVAAAAAAALTTIPADLRYSLTDAPGANSYPIAGTTWAVAYLNHPTAATGPALAEFLWWATHEGQTQAADLHYVPLPPELVALVELKLRSLGYKRGK
jgi:phosphate ABC transporter phosphate-binding protein